jgi:hypothetical protein
VSPNTVSETWFSSYLEFHTLDKVQKPLDSDYLFVSLMEAKKKIEIFFPKLITRSLIISSVIFLCSFILLHRI